MSFPSRRHVLGRGAEVCATGLPNNLVVVFDDLRADFTGHLNALLPVAYTGTVMTPNFDARDS